MIELNKISFSYDDGRNVLQKVSFSLNKGGTIGIVGASGCGKSTLLRIISGILPSSHSHKLEGDIQVEGVKPQEYRKSGKLSFMFQEPTLMPNLSVKKNIELPLTIKGKSDKEKVYEILSMVGLSDFSNFLPKQLSGGMKTRVALARSFITEPNLLLLDEPFSSLDVAWKHTLYNELDILKNTFDTTIVLVTHDIEEVLRFSGKNILVFGKHGSIIYSASLNGKSGLKNEIENIIIDDHNLENKVI